MMTNWDNKVLYAGVTDNLEHRVYEHKDKLVYFEYTSDVNSAIARENKLKVVLDKRKMKLNVAKKRPSYPKSNYRKNPATYPGERVQIDVKYIPNEYIGFASHHKCFLAAK